MVVTVFGMGFAAGALHAITGPDHMAVLLPSCIGRPASRTWKTGARWGLGHGLGASGFGALAIAVKSLLYIDIAAASHWLELGLACALVFIGTNGLRETGAEGAAAVARLVAETELTVVEDGTAAAGAAHVHGGSSGGDGGSGGGGADAAAAERELFITKRGKMSPMTAEQMAGDEPTHAGAAAAAAAVAPSELSTTAAVGTGILHGFTGTGHLVGVLPALGMATSSGAAIYLGGFCIGTLLAMAVFTAVVGFLTLRLQRSVGPSALVYVSKMASIFAIVMGVVIFFKWLSESSAVTVHVTQPPHELPS